MNDRLAETAVMPNAEIGGRAFAEALAETTPALVCVVDRDGRILLFNEACERATGFSREEVVGQDACDFVIPPEDAEPFRGMLRHIWETGLPDPQVGHWLRRDGERLLVAWSNKPVLGDDGRPVYLVTTGLDITERERAEEERRALEGDLAAKLGEVARLAEEQTSLRRVATLVAGEAPAERVFAAVSEECARVLETEAAAVFQFQPDGTATVVGRYDRDRIEAFPTGSSLPLTPFSAIGRVHATGEAATIDDYSELPGEIAEVMRKIGLRFTVAAPIAVGGRLWGAVAVTSRRAERPPAGAEVRLRRFCELVSLAVASAEAREELRASRARIVRAGDDARRQLERNLHDGAQQQLVSVSVALRLARTKLESDPRAAVPMLESAATNLDQALAELRELARGLHPAVLSERGLTAALTSLAERAPFAVEVAKAPAERYPEEIEAAAYYVVSEALANVAKHAQANAATVTVGRDDGVVAVEVRDDGRGGADLSRGSGLVGLRDRVDALGGSLWIESPPGGGTVVRAQLPLSA